MRRAVILVPSGFTLFNLFFGIYAIITASQGDFKMAGVWVLCGGICDALDGRVARVANAGTQFGEELDSLVDAISFGLAPAMIMYFAVLKHENWDWIFVFLFAACAVMRLARFNIEQAGATKTYFQGLPSPAAGCTLASYYWFSQSQFYSYGAIGNLPWYQMLRFVIAGLGVLMISNVPYPVLPRTGLRSIRGILASILVFGSFFLFITNRLQFFFPLCVAYVLWGLLRSTFFRLFERRQPTVPYDLSEGEDDEDEDDEPVPAVTAPPVRSVARERKPRLERPERASAPVADADAQHGERPKRADRPERTPEERAERAARREKRASRDKRDRPPRPDRVASISVAASDGAVEDAPEPVIGMIPGGADGASSAAADGDSSAPARKRKRRRRRSERGPRDRSAAGDDSASDPDGDLAAGTSEEPRASTPVSGAPSSSDSSE